jgi:hypothetical protein
MLKTDRYRSSASASGSLTTALTAIALIDRTLCVAFEPSEVPIRQGIAVTGSVNQSSEIQAIGRINHKIEGASMSPAARPTGRGELMPPFQYAPFDVADVIDAVRRAKFTSTRSARSMRNRSAGRD